ncbi:MAG: hypothetical protein RL032_740 [Pseudomonadota bacterium]
MRRAFWALAALVVVWGAAWAAVPALLKWQIEARGSAALGRQLTLSAIDFKPWSLELTVKDIAVATADGRGSQFSVARVVVDAELQSLLHLAPVVDALTIESPKVRVTHLGEGKYDFDDILQRLQPPVDAPPSMPLKFAVHNVVLSGGELDFVDRIGTAERLHTLRKLDVALPFLSNLESQRDILVTPKLAFELNGSRFDSTAQGTPFALSRSGESAIRIQRLDIAPYLPYLPASLPVTLKGAVLDTDLKLSFSQSPKVSVALSGTVTVDQLKLVDAVSKEFLTVERVQTVLKDVRPLERVVHLESVTVTGPNIAASRSANGVLSPLFGVKPPPQNATKSIAAYASPTEPSIPWKIALDKFELQGGTATWADDTTAPGARYSVAQVELQAQDMQWPFAGKPTSFEGALTVPTQARANAKDRPARVTFKGSGTDTTGLAQLVLSDVALGLATPYSAPYVVPSLAGKLDAQMSVQWKNANVLLNLQRLALADVTLQDAAAVSGTLPRFKLLEVTQAEADLSAKTVRVGKVALRSLSAALERDAQGHWMFERWLRVPTQVQNSVPAMSTQVAQPATAASWAVSVAELVIDDSAIAFDDKVPAKPVSFALSGVGVQAKALALDGKKPVSLVLSARLKAGSTEPGTLKFNGTVAWDPVLAQGTLEALHLPAHAFVPYVADQLNVDILRADASVKGSVRYAAVAAGAQVQLKGDAALDEFQANSVLSASNTSLLGGEELLRWKSLNVPGIEVDMQPNTPPRVKVREAALTDFYARVVVNPQGRLNLQDVVKTTVQARSAGQPGAAPPPTASDTSESSALISVGPVSLVNGRVLFSDRFIQPNYSADLTQLTGKLSQFSSQPRNGVVQLADLELRGRAEGTASLEITGKLNPLAKPLALDIQGRVRDLELPPLSPYAIKYAGYGIERGKLSVDVNYTIKPDGQLTASNKLVLNQLSFGEKVEGAPNSLPVKLAVALLADRNGVIDLNLPISGSLNDPQFSIGPVVWKVLTNLIVKALTSPFSLLASAFGGGDELSAVVFPAGVATLTSEAKQGLDKVAKALTERTALKMTVVGTASLEAERDALKKDRLTALLLTEKRRRAVVAGQDASTVVTVSPTEAADLLKEVYKRADMTKPRNVVGMAKDLPSADMQALLLANISVNEDSMRALALARGVVVRDYLAARNLPTDRLFVGAAKTVAPSADWQPHADLTLNSQ